MSTDLPPLEELEEIFGCKASSSISVKEICERILTYLLSHDEFSVNRLHLQFGGGLSYLSFKTGPLQEVKEKLIQEHHRVFAPRRRSNGGKSGWLYLTDAAGIEDRGERFQRTGVKKIGRSKDLLQAAVATALPHHRDRLSKKLDKFEQNVKSAIHARIRSEMQPQFPTESKSQSTPGKKM